jgi:integrase
VLHQWTASQSEDARQRRIASDNGVLDIGTHDLRRTLATCLGEMGVADEVIERVLNHAPRTVAGKHYNHAKLFEGMRTALEAWSERSRGIVDGAEAVSNVRPLRITGSQS